MAPAEGPSYDPKEECKPSEEKLALMEFAYRLGSCNYPNEPGIAADEGTTRNDAKLLMSLLVSPPRLDGGLPHRHHDDLDPISSSESEESVAPSDSSSCSRRESLFSFTCPSLSLESSSGSDSSGSTSTTSGHSLLRPPPTARRLFEDVMERTKTVDETPLPAKLLGRPLKVDDRDALRLSADAMARNIRQSFQKALHWRIHAWIQALSKSLVRKEKEMRECGASEDDLKELLDTCEARLILQLREVANVLQVTATGTSFQVLGQCPAKSGGRNANGEPATKKLRTEDQTSAGLQEGDNYQYEVAHVLQMECVVTLQTPAGFSEVTLQVPGAIEGTFLSTGTGMEELKSIVIELDTNMLAAMVEKSCRTIARASVEAITKKHDGEDNNTDEESQQQKEEPVATTSSELKTPPLRVTGPIFTANEVRAALVTPRARMSDGSRESSSGSAASPQPMLLPIPDNFDERQSNHRATSPRRISPQPHVTYSSELSCTGTHFAASVPYTPNPAKYNSSPSLISPPINDAPAEYYHRKTSKDGPSLPMLVEAACRVMQD